tara:strand:+ start:464 stop:781 length:318 start_codon:yes stop_codon:yes gene_type:complete
MVKTYDLPKFEKGEIGFKSISEFKEFIDNFSLKALSRFDRRLFFAHYTWSPEEWDGRFDNADDLERRYRRYAEFKMNLPSNEGEEEDLTVGDLLLFKDIQEQREY